MPTTVPDDLAALSEFAELSENQKKIVLCHVGDPELTRHEISKQTGVNMASVYSFFRTKAWNTINDHICRKQFSELTQLAMRTLHACMLQNRNYGVKLDAASRVLMNVGLMLPPKSHFSNRTDNKMVIMWGTDNEKIDLNLNGITDTLQSTPKANGSSQLQGSV